MMDSSVRSDDCLENSCDFHDLRCPADMTSLLKKVLVKKYGGIYGGGFTTLTPTCTPFLSFKEFFQLAQ
jgi:hypothetical protein